MSKFVELRSDISHGASDNTGQNITPVFPLWLHLGFWACVVIAVAAVIRRVFALFYPPHSAPPQLAGLDRVFASHAALTLAHILPAFAFVLVAPFFVFRKSSETEWPEHILFPLGLVVGVTAYAMSTYSIGGWVERSAVLVFNTLFLLALFRAYLYMRRGELLLKRAWLIRAIAILLGISRHPPCDGSFLCDQTFNTSSTEPVLRHRFLDWIFNQHHGWRVLAQAIPLLQNTGAGRNAITR